MAKFDRNDRVMFRHDGQVHRAKVTQVTPHKRRVVTDSGKRLEVPVRRLRRSPDRVLILEARLDRGLNSPRAYGPMMQQWLYAYDVVALYEKVHTVEAMRRFLRREGKNVTTRFVHIMAHGTDEPGTGTAFIKLTFEKLDLVKDAKVFAGLKGKIIIFSCCEVGADTRAMEAVKEASGAKAIIGYRLPVEDWYTNLTEVLLYDRILSTAWSPKKAVQAVNKALSEAGVRARKRAVRKPVLVCV